MFPSIKQTAKTYLLSSVGYLKNYPWCEISRFFKTSSSFEFHEHRSSYHGWKKNVRRNEERQKWYLTGPIVIIAFNNDRESFGDVYRFPVFEARFTEFTLKMLLRWVLQNHLESPNNLSYGWVTFKLRLVRNSRVTPTPLVTKMGIFANVAIPPLDQILFLTGEFSIVRLNWSSFLRLCEGSGGQYGSALCM